MSIPFGSLSFSQPADYFENTVVTLTAFPDVSGGQVIWNGVDSQSGSVANVRMAGDRFVTVSVVQPTPTQQPPTPMPPTATPTSVPVTLMPTPTPTPTPTPITLIPHIYGSPIIGVNLEAITPEVVAREGLLVTRGQFVLNTPNPRSAGAALGLKRADVITLVNNRDVGTRELFNSVFSPLKAGEEILVTFVRGSTKFERNVSLGAYYDTGNISAGAVHRLNYFLEPGQTLEFYFVELGGNDVAFSISDPDGESVIPRTRKVSLDGELTAVKLGAYQVVFDNGFSFFTSKRIYWAYRITR